MNPFEFAQDARDFIPCEHDRQVRRCPRVLHPVKPRQLDAEHILVKEGRCASRLVLRRRCDVALDRKMRQEYLDLRRAQCRRMPFAVKQNEAC